MRFEPKTILNATTSQPIFTTQIEKSTFSGSKKGYTLLQHHTGLPIAHIRFSTMDSHNIALTIHGAPNKITEDGKWVHFRWCFTPVAFPGKVWWWTEKKRRFELRDEGDVVIARIEGDVLLVENVGLSERAVDEVVASAFAMWLQKRKEKGNREAGDAIGEIAGAIAG